MNAWNGDPRFSLEGAERIIARWHAVPDEVITCLDERASEHVRARLALPVTIRWNSRFIALAGRCTTNLALIELSANHAWTPEAFRDTVTHEYAHFLDGDLEGRRPHGAIWRKVHVNLGRSGRRTHSLCLLPGVQRPRREPAAVRCANWCIGGFRTKRVAERAVRECIS